MVEQRISIERSNFHDSLHGIDIECTAASCIGRILEVFLGWRHSGCSHVVPHSFHLNNVSFFVIIITIIIILLNKKEK